jgi:hypothetical protein
MRPSTPSGGVRSAICRIAKSSKVIFKFDDVTATKFLMHPMFSGCTNWPRLEKGKGKKRAAGVTAASVATAVDLEGKEGGAPPVKRPNSSLLEEAVYAMGAFAGDPRANALYMELHNEDVARRVTYFVSAKNIAAPGARGSPHLHACTPKVGSTFLPKVPAHPLHFPLWMAPQARVILDFVSNC